MQNHTTPFLRRVNIDGDWQIETGHVSAKTRPYKSQECRTIAGYEAMHAIRKGQGPLGRQR